MNALELTGNAKSENYFPILAPQGAYKLLCHHDIQQSRIVHQFYLCFTNVQ